MATRQRGERLGCVVAPAQEHERRVVQRLHAQRHAVDAGPRQVGEARGLDRAGIGFQRDLDVRRPTVQRSAIRSITAAAVAGSISDGVPPPKKIEVTVRPGVRSA